MIIEDGKSTVNGAVVHGAQANLATVECTVDHGTIPGITIRTAAGCSMGENVMLALKGQVRAALRDMGQDPHTIKAAFELSGVTSGCTATDGLALPMTAALLEASGLREERFSDSDVLVGTYRDGSWSVPAGVIAVSEETARSRRDLLLPEGFESAVDARFVAGGVSVLAGIDPCAPGAVHDPAVENRGRLPEPSPMDISSLSMDTIVSLEAVALRQPVLFSSGIDGEALAAARLVETAVSAPSRHREALSELAGDGASAMVHPEMSLASILGGGRPVTPGALAIAGDGVLVLHDIDRFPFHVLGSIAGGWDALRIVRFDGLYTFHTGFAPVATCRAGQEAAARRALQEICFDHVPYQATLPFVPDARAVIADLGGQHPLERGCLARYVAERRETLRDSGVESLGVEESVKSWPVGMDRPAFKIER